MKKDVMFLGTSVLTTGVLAGAVEKAGGNASGLNSMAGFFPVMGTTMGAGASLEMLTMIKKPKARRRR